MSYKEKMHPTVSRAEIEVFKALSQAGLTTGMVTQQPTVLRSTIPDFQWSQKRKAVYLDGIQVHRKDKVEARDMETDELMEQRGWAVLRIPYEAPLTTVALKNIMVQIKQFLNVDEEDKETKFEG